MVVNKISVRQLCSSIRGNHEVLGARDIYVSIASPIDKSGKESVTFCSKKTADGLIMIKDSRAGVVICSKELVYKEDYYKDKTLILVSSPRLAFIEVMQEYFQRKIEFSIHPTAIIDKDAKLHADVYVGPNACIMDKCEIGKNTIIHGNVYMYPNVKIGSNVIIHAGTIIGADGFSYERNDKGELEKFPHFGGVIIEDAVEIGSNVSIDRGTMDNTIIGQGTKIDNFCHIAHNVVIGKHCMIIAQSMIGGSTKIGDYSWIAPCACLKDGINVGRNVVVGMGAVVTKDIDDNCVVVGMPARVVRKTA